MGKRWGAGYGQLVPYVGELGGELQYITYKKWFKKFNVKYKVAFIGRIEMDFLKGEMFYGLQASGSLVVPLARMGRKCKNWKKS